MENPKTLLNDPCVLLVDDDEDWLRLMQYTLKKEGLTAEASVNGVDIWEKIETCHPHVILMDIQMDGVSGETFCKSLKTNPTTCEIPLLMYSSNQDIHAISKRCGADGYVKKSSSPVEIREKVMQYV